MFKVIFMLVWPAFPSKLGLLFGSSTLSKVSRAFDKAALKLVGPWLDALGVDGDGEGLAIMRTRLLGEHEDACTSHFVRFDVLRAFGLFSTASARRWRL